MHHLLLVVVKCIIKVIIEAALKYTIRRKVIHKVTCFTYLFQEGLGFSEPTLLQAAINCVQEGGGTEDVKSKCTY